MVADKLINRGASEPYGRDNAKEKVDLTLPPATPDQCSEG